MLEDPNKTTPTPLDQLGEFELITHLTKNDRPLNEGTLKGIGDDAAVLKPSKETTVVTTDMLTEGVHFDLLYTPPKHLGYKAVIANLSDVYAMNARPTQITVGIGVSNRMSVEFLEAFYEGVHKACELYGVDLIGGDTVSTATGLVISITAMGTAQEKDLAFRDGAKDNDLICVSGDLGAAYMGLQLLEREKQIYEDDPNIQPDLSGHDYVLERQLKPEARKDVHKALADAGIQPTAMIDISDGLSSDLLHICQQSKAGCQIYEDKVPIDPATAMLAEQFHMAPITAALNGGEDYELLFTVNMNDFEKVKEIPNVSVIGHITDISAGCQMVLNGGQSVDLVASGWNAFSGAEGDS